MEYTYVCDIRVSFPTTKIAQQVKQVMEVDRETGNRVVKTFSLESAGQGSEKGDEGGNVLRM
jgi:Transcription factor Pcc1